LPPRDGSTEWKKASDRRFEHRVQAWITSHENMKIYSKAGAEVRQTILPLLKDTALGEGFWSIWMAAFQGFPEVQQALIDSFPGTRQTFFQNILNQ
jgi:hypothetical protein